MSRPRDIPQWSRDARRRPSSSRPASSVVSITRHKGGDIIAEPTVPVWSLVDRAVVLRLSRQFDARRIPPRVYVLALKATAEARAVHITGGQTETMRALAEVLGQALPRRIVVTWDDPFCSGVAIPSTRRPEWEDGR